MQQISSSSFQAASNAPGAVLRPAAILALVDWPVPWRTTTSSQNLRNIGNTKQHKRHLSSHNLRMHPHAKLTNLYAVDQPVLRAALQYDKVYPPRLSSIALAGIAARRINAIR